MKPQVRLLQNDWDVLIVLDACRYDTFDNIYQNWLTGELIKTRSSGRDTTEWLVKTWRKKYDLTYLSGNPYINSQGVPYDGFHPTKHFTEIINVWDFGWNMELGTVLPIEINKAVLDHPRNKRMIIHYMQPHFPYIGRTGIYRRGGPCISRSHILRTKGRKRKQTPSPRLGKVDAYIETLDLGLQRVSELIPHLDGKIVVTSDHGELLGEGGIWGHGRKFGNRPELREVPWFEVAK